MSQENSPQEDIDKTIPTDFSQVGDVDKTQPTNLNTGVPGNPDTLPTIAANLQDDATKTLADIGGSAAPTVSIGTPQIPGYEIVRLLGEGGMGVVYEAKQTAIHRTVALKVLKPAVAAEPEFRDRFLRESAAAGKVTHPNVVQIFDAGEANGHLFMTFQMIEGGDLSELIKAKGMLSEFKALKIIKECLQGLHAIHEAGLVHRDIKPGNIFMEDSRRPVIGDLGLARQTSGDDRMTMTGAAMGTPSYMSPEHIRGVADIDIRTDIYAFGSTLYKMLTGVEPFQGETVYAITHSIISQPIPDPREINTSLSNPAVGIIRKSMAKDREERYQTPEQFIQDIDAALGGHQLIHAEGMGTIEGVEKAKPKEMGKASRPTAPMKHAGPSPSFLKTLAKPIAVVAVIAWFLLVLDWVRIDKSKYEPDWASLSSSDYHGNFITLQVGSQTLNFRYIRAGEKHGDVIVGAKEGAPQYREEEALSLMRVQKDYWISETEVTQAFFQELMDDNPSDYNNAYFPVHNVSHEDVESFLEKLNQRFDKEQYKSPFTARLPDQIEWEHACRAGNELKPYGDQDVMDAIGLSAKNELYLKWLELWRAEEPLDHIDQETIAWELVQEDMSKYGPQVVKKMQPNRWGLYDMIGNVAELCSNSWDGVSDKGNHAEGDYKMAHGGSWFDHPDRCRAACRIAILPNEGSPFIGFRIVIEVASKKKD